VKAASVRVRGRVQGVGFRAFAQQRARELGVQGFVRNRPDGSVEAWLQGEGGAIDRLIEHLRKGPMLARVDALELEPGTPEPSTGTFQIR